MTEQITITAEKLGSYVVTLPISAITVSSRFRQDMGDIAALAASIKELGLLQPIGIDRDHNLIFGERRLRAHQHLGLDNIQARIIEVPSLLQAEHDENELRKSFTPSERVAIARAIEEELGDRRRFNADGGPKVDDSIPQNFAELHGRESREIAAEKAGFGNPETYRQARKVTEEAVPELVDAMDRGDIAISTAAKLVTAPPETQQYAAENPKEAPAIAHNHRAQCSGKYEWYTPSEYLDLARQVLGDFDLDPASSSLANETVKAQDFYTIEDNGLEREWFGRIWMNPPYAQPTIAQFADRIIEEWEMGRIESAIVLTHNSTDTNWFHRLASASTAICFTKGRISFINPDGKQGSPTQGQAFFYFGPDAPTFCAEFQRIGFAVDLRHRKQGGQGTLQAKEETPGSDQGGLGQ